MTRGQSNSEHAPQSFYVRTFGIFEILTPCITFPGDNNDPVKVISDPVEPLTIHLSAWTLDPPWQTYPGSVSQSSEHPSPFTLFPSSH